jgi:hypothetical protein
LQGTGFAPGLTISVGSANAPVVATSAGQMLLAIPAQADGAQTITVTDPVSGSFSVMTNALTFGAAATDTLVLLPVVNPPVPVGTQAISPMVVRVVAADKITPVPGATVVWSTTNLAALSACGGKLTCSAVSDESGLVSTLVTPGATGNAAITATLAPAVYNPAQSVTATITTTASTSTGIGVTTPYLWIAEGASLSVPITARVVAGPQGSPQSGVIVNFFIAQGSGSLSAPSAMTDSNGYASVNLTLSNFNASMEVNACIGQGNSPCQNVYGNAVNPAMFRLQAVAGASQVVTGTAFQPFTIRVTDSSTPPNPVIAAAVLFQSTVLRPAGGDLTLVPGNGGTQTGMPVILSSTESSVQSDANGLASFTPSTGSFTGTLEIEIAASAGLTATLQNVMETFPGSSGNAFPTADRMWHGSNPTPRRPPRASHSFHCHFDPARSEGEKPTVGRCRQTADSSLRSE